MPKIIETRLYWQLPVRSMLINNYPMGTQELSTFFTPKNSDAGFQSAMVAILNDKGATGMIRNFESAVANLRLMDPVVKRRLMGTKQGTDQILDTVVEVSTLRYKPGIG